MLNKTKWSIDPTHSSIQFKVRHLMIANVKGVFKKFEASIYTTEKNFSTAEIDVTIEASSIDTGDTTRDEHLKSVDFFDVIKFPQINFTASSIAPSDADGKHELWGRLTMKGITKLIQLNAQFGGIVKDPWGIEKAGFTITGKINRSDWGLVWNATLETGVFMVSEEIAITGEVELMNAVKKNDELLLEAVSNEKNYY